MAIAMIAMTWNLCAMLSGAVLLSLSALLAMQQYRAAFRGNANSAAATAVLLFLVGGMGLFGFAATLGEMLLDGVQLPWWSLLLPMLAVGGLSCAAA